MGEKAIEGPRRQEQIKDQKAGGDWVYSYFIILWPGKFSVFSLENPGVMAA
jgi:hypothetical protein